MDASSVEGDKEVCPYCYRMVKRSYMPIHNDTKYCKDMRAWSIISDILNKYMVDNRELKEENERLEEENKELKNK